MRGVHQLSQAQHDAMSESSIPSLFCPLQERGNDLSRRDDRPATTQWTEMGGASSYSVEQRGLAIPIGMARGRLDDVRRVTRMKHDFLAGSYDVVGR